MHKNFLMGEKIHNHNFTLRYPGVYRILVTGHARTFTPSAKKKLM